MLHDLAAHRGGQLQVVAARELVEGDQCRAGRPITTTSSSSQSIRGEATVAIRWFAASQVACGEGSMSNTRSCSANSW